MSVATCVECGAKSDGGDVWQPGQWCLFGNLFACSLACCEKWARENAAVGYRPGEKNFDAVEPAAKAKAK